PARRVRGEPAALRRHGGARAGAGGVDDGGALTPADGLERERHRAGERTRGRGDGAPHGATRGPAKRDRDAHRRGPDGIHRHGGGARALGRRSARRPRRGRGRAPVRAPPPRTAARRGAGGSRMSEEWRVDVDQRVATVTLSRPERKNPLTFDSYAQLRDWF